jgi:hypothetical protein
LGIIALTVSSPEQVVLYDCQLVAHDASDASRPSSLP